jgi:hypothetical protein
MDILFFWCRQSNLPKERSLELWQFPWNSLYVPFSEHGAPEPYILLLDVHVSHKRGQAIEFYK